MIGHRKLEPLKQKENTREDITLVMVDPGAQSTSFVSLYLLALPRSRKIRSQDRHDGRFKCSWTPGRVSIPLRVHTKVLGLITCVLSSGRMPT